MFSLINYFKNDVRIKKFCNILPVDSERLLNIDTTVNYSTG